MFGRLVLSFSTKNILTCVSLSLEELNNKTSCKKDKYG